MTERDFLDSNAPHSPTSPVDPVTEAFKQKLAAMAPGFLAQRSKELAELPAEDLDAAKRFAHRLAGSGAMFGFEELTSMGRAVEAAAVRQDPLETAKLLSEVRSLLEQLQRHWA